MHLGVICNCNVTQRLSTTAKTIFLPRLCLSSQTIPFFWERKKVRCAFNRGDLFDGSVTQIYASGQCNCARGPGYIYMRGVRVAQMTGKVSWAVIMSKSRDSSIDFGSTWDEREREREALARDAFRGRALAVDREKNTWANARCEKIVNADPELKSVETRVR